MGYSVPLWILLSSVWLEQNFWLAAGVQIDQRFSGFQNYHFFGSGNSQGCSVHTLKRFTAGMLSQLQLIFQYSWWFRSLGTASFSILNLRIDHSKNFQVSGLLLGVLHVLHLQCSGVLWIIRDSLFTKFLVDNVFKIL